MSSKTETRIYSIGIALEHLQQYWLTTAFGYRIYREKNCSRIYSISGTHTMCNAKFDMSFFLILYYYS
jgi:hypothetical protein